MTRPRTPNWLSHFRAGKRRSHLSWPAPLGIRFDEQMNGEVPASLMRAGRGEEEERDERGTRYLSMAFRAPIVTVRISRCKPRFLKSQKSQQCGQDERLADWQGDSCGLQGGGDIAMPYGRDRASFERTWPPGWPSARRASATGGRAFLPWLSASRQTGSSQCDNYLHCS